MKKRIRLKKKKKIKPILLIALTLMTYLSIKYINKELSPKLVHYAELETRKLSGLVITEAIKAEDIEKINMNEMFIITRNEKNEILTVDLNTVILNKMIIKSTTTIQEKLKEIEKGIILKIPLGEIYNNFLLNNLGPKIPVKLKILGDMENKINTNIKNYGINNALIEITLEITVKEEVILPITTKEIEVKQTIPIIVKIITGTVPNFYSNGINKSETFSIPIE